MEIPSHHKLAVTSLFRAVNALPLHLRLRISFQCTSKFKMVGVQHDQPLQGSSSNQRDPSSLSPPGPISIRVLPLPAMLLNHGGAHLILGLSSNGTYAKTQSLIVLSSQNQHRPLFLLVAPSPVCFSPDQILDLQPNCSQNCSFWIYLSAPVPTRK